MYTIYDLPEQGSSGLTESEVEIATTPDFQPGTFVWTTVNWSPTKQSVRLDNPQANITYYSRIRLKDNAGNPPGPWVVSTAMSYQSASSSLDKPQSEPAAQPMAVNQPTPEPEVAPALSSLYLSTPEEKSAPRSFDTTLIWRFNFSQDRSTIWNFHCQIATDPEFGSIVFSDSYGKGKISLVFQAPSQNVNYYARFQIQTREGLSTWSDASCLYWQAPGSQAAPSLPGHISLGQNYPNPFNPETWIPIKLNKPASLKLKIFNSQGLLIKTFEFNDLSSGDHRLRWDGRDQFGQIVSSGVYFYQLIVSGKPIATKKMLVQRWGKTVAE